MEWPEEFYARRAGTVCEMCEQGRPEETPHGVRYFAGEVATPTSCAPTSSAGSPS